MANAGNLPDLATVVQHITSAQPGSYAGLAHQLKSFGTEEQKDAILGGLLPGAQDPLALLHPRINTLGYLYILSARLAGGNAAAPVNPATIELFCKEFDPEQARLASARVTKFAKCLISWAEGSNRTKFVIAPLHHLLTRLPPDSTHLTPLHPLFVQTCLRAQHTAPSLLRPILSSPITQVSTSLFPDLAYTDNLIYHYLGGIIFALWKEWESAEEFFEIVVTSPAQVASAIQWEAMKKYVLVQCIFRGKTPSLPKYVHGTLARLLKNSAYGAFQRSFPRSTIQLKELLQKEAETFSNDRNQGLINLAMNTAPRWNIKRLTDTYLSLSLAEIGKEIGVESESAVRSLVIGMIERGEIYATLGDDGSVAFADAPVVVSKAQVDAALRQAQAQSETLLALEREVGVSKEFLSKVLKNRDEERYLPSADVDEMMFASAGGGAVWAEEMF